jgi:hypothetical protein
LYVKGLEKLEPRFIMRSLGYFVKREEKEDMGNIEVNYGIYLLYPKMECDLYELIRGEKAKKFTEADVIIFLIQMIYAI